MFVTGESLYKDCETPKRHAQAAIDVACPFHTADMASWCKRCLVAKIELLRAELLRISVGAERSAKERW